MKIAESHPFDGAPEIHMPSLFGNDMGKDFFYKIPVTGKRPITVTVSNLPEGTVFDGHILRGNVKQPFDGIITVNAENEIGKSKKEIHYIINKNVMALTPILGFTSWNAFAEGVDAEKIERTAFLLDEKGFSDYGYQFINIDSGWQEKYGGKLDAVQPNFKFPDMKKTVEYIHSLGLKAGIYSTPFKNAWGCPGFLPEIPGTTRGEPDILFPNYNCGIGKERLEKNNALQWNEWGIDYLKYDWMPCVPILAEAMRAELDSLPREFLMCVTVDAGKEYGEYWKKRICSWRKNNDSLYSWENIKYRLSTVDGWEKYVCAGHFYDLDMLEIGPSILNIYGKDTEKPCITEDEAIFSYTMRSFFISPIQLSCSLESLTDFEFSLFTNEEVIALNQDSLCNYPILIGEEDGLKIYVRNTENNSRVYAFFNTSDEEKSSVLSLEAKFVQRDLWLKKDIAVSPEINCTVPLHGARLIKIYK